MESLLGIALIFMPQVILKVFKLKIPAAIVLFTGFSCSSLSFRHRDAFDQYHLFWDKILHAVSPMVLTALGYGLIGYLMKDAEISKPVLGCSSYSALRLLDFAACFGSSGNSYATSS